MLPCNFSPQLPYYFSPFPNATMYFVILPPHSHPSKMLQYNCCPLFPCPSKSCHMIYSPFVAVQILPTSTPPPLIPNPLKSSPVLLPCLR